MDISPSRGDWGGCKARPPLNTSYNVREYRKSRAARTPLIGAICLVERLSLEIGSVGCYSGNMALNWSHNERKQRWAKRMAVSLVAQAQGSAALEGQAVGLEVINRVEKRTEAWLLNSPDSQREYERYAEGTI